MKLKSNVACYFIRSSGVLLLITALAKIISATGSAKIMALSAPIIGISYRDLFIMVGLAEFMVAISLLFGKNLNLQACASNLIMRPNFLIIG
jgi:hypothetical protein